VLWLRAGRGRDRGNSGRFIGDLGAGQIHLPSSPVNTASADLAVIQEGARCSDGVVKGATTWLIQGRQLHNGQRLKPKPKWDTRS
jgi:hypothetical protein